MVKYAATKLLAMKAAGSELETYVKVLLQAGLLRKTTTRGGIVYEVTRAGVQFLKEYDEKTGGQGLGLDIPSRMGWRIRVVNPPQKSRKSSVKYMLKDVIRLADHVAKESRRVEAILRRGGRDYREGAKPPLLHLPPFP